MFWCENKVLNEYEVFQNKNRLKPKDTAREIKLKSCFILLIILKC